MARKRRGGPMGKRPATQFYWGDWLNCKELRVCSLEARGLWIDVLAYMRQGKPIGHLTHENGQPITPEQLARLVGEPVTKVKRLLAELERNGVPNKTDDGIYISRRMVREEVEYESYRQQREEDGKKGAQKRWPEDDRDPDDDPTKKGKGEHRVGHADPTTDPIKSSKGEHSSSSSSSVRTSTNQPSTINLRTGTDRGTKNARSRALTPSVIAFRRQRSKQTTTGKPKFAVIRALARSIVATHPQVEDSGEIEDLVMRACARDVNLLYTSAVVKRAVEQAQAQLRRMAS